MTRPCKKSWGDLAKVPRKRDLFPTLAAENQLGLPSFVCEFRVSPLFRPASVPEPHHSWSDAPNHHHAEVTPEWCPLRAGLRAGETVTRTNLSIPRPHLRPSTHVMKAATSAGARGKWEREKEASNQPHAEMVVGRVRSIQWSVTLSEPDATGLTEISGRVCEKHRVARCCQPTFGTPHHPEVSANVLQIMWMQFVLLLDPHCGSQPQSTRREWQLGDGFGAVRSSSLNGSATALFALA